MSAPRPPRRLSRIRLAAAMALTLLATEPGAPARAETDPSDEAADAFFRGGAAPRLKILLDPGAVEALRKEPRTWVRAVLRENEKTVYTGVGVKLKGAAGSFREFDDKPAVTVKMDEFDGKSDFHGLEKFYLNNSVQDDTLLSEWVGSEAFRAAGLPAPRVAHARVWLNERELGAYVLKEGYDRRFLRRNFPDAKGNLYDGGFCVDLDGGLERDEGKGPDDKADLQELMDGCRATDPKERHDRIERRLDVDRFLTYMAVERMLGHWDGYCMNRNNYRVYFVPPEGKAVFLPHGMDQLLQDPDATIFDDPVAALATAVLRDPQWNAAWRKRVKELLPVFSPPDRLARRIDEVAGRLRSVPGGAGGAGAMKSRWAARAKSLAEQVSLPAPKPVPVPKGGLRLRNWRPVVEAGAARCAQVTVGAERALRITCGPGAAVGTWRTKVLLAPGRYRIEGSAKTDGVVPPPEGPGGARLRVADGGESVALVEAGTWKAIEAAFEVVQPRSVEFVAELRAQGGEAHFRVGAFKVVKVE